MAGHGADRQAPGTLPRMSPEIPSVRGGVEQTFRIRLRKYSGNLGQPLGSDGFRRKACPASSGWRDFAKLKSKKLDKNS